MHITAISGVAFIPRSGDIAESLYHQLGWQVAGQIPGYALSTAGELDDTTVMYKQRGG